MLLANPLPALAGSEHHRPGCNTSKCDHHIDRWLARLLRLARPSGEPGVASWFDDNEATACGTHYVRGVAHKELACGTRVRICNEGSCETAVVEDRGPFIAGRVLDLNPGAKAAINCPDICHVRWSVM